MSRARFSSPAQPWFQPSTPGTVEGLSAGHLQSLVVEGAGWQQAAIAYAGDLQQGVVQASVHFMTFPCFRICRLERVNWKVEPED
jgi:hypothetical protein